MFLAALAPLLIKTVGGIIDQVVEDKDAAAKIKAGVQDKLIGLESKALEGQISIIVAEASGKGWAGFLKSSWRPITMLAFVVTVVAWVWGLTPERGSAELMASFFDIIKIGLGGYVVSRGAEKIAQTVAPALFRKND